MLAEATQSALGPRPLALAGAEGASLFVASCIHDSEAEYCLHHQPESGMGSFFERKHLPSPDMCCSASVPDRASVHRCKLARVG